MTSEVSDVTGLATLVGAIVLNIWDMASSLPINGWFVIATSVGGLIYLYWKIRTQKKAAHLKDLEIEKALLEIEELKKGN